MATATFAVEPSTLIGGIPWERERLIGAVVPARDDVRISFPQAVCPLDAIVRYELGGPSSRSVSS